MTPAALSPREVLWVSAVLLLALMPHMTRFPLILDFGFLSACLWRYLGAQNRLPLPDREHRLLWLMKQLLAIAAFTHSSPLSKASPPPAPPVEEVNRQLDVSLPEGPGWSTVAGLAIARVGAIPPAGTLIALEGGLSLEVLESSGRRIQLVRVRSPRVVADEEEEEPVSEPGEAP